MTHDLAIGFLLWLWSRAGRSEASSQQPAPSAPAYPSTPPALPAGGNTRPAPPQWPQALPEGLPPFPGSGWEYDEPPPVAVQQRAKQLLDQLWAKGSGASKTELTGGRWITFQAALVASGKKGVVAWRIKKASAPRAQPAPGRVMTASAPVLPKTTPAAPSSARPAPTPVRVVIPPKRPTPEQARQQTEASQRYGLPLPQELPDLKEGMGTKAKPNEHVRLAQQRLLFHGFKLPPPGDDGVFGNATRMAVIELQKRSALAPRVSNEELVQRGFGAVKRATWEVLLQDRPILSSPPLVRA